MSDERPKPKFGEYAPEGWAWTPPPSESAGEQEIIESETARPAFTPLASSTAPGGATVRPRANRTADRWITAFLLGMGIISTINSVPTYLNLGAALTQVFAQAGIGAFTAFDAAGRAGQVAAIAQIVVLLAAIAISVLLLRAGRFAFYVPLSGAALSIIVSVICTAAAIFADPAALQLATVTSTSAP